jgi:hypothetical protein
MAEEDQRSLADWLSLLIEEEWQTRHGDDDPEEEPTRRRLRARARPGL